MLRVHTHFSTAMREHINRCICTTPDHSLLFLLYRIKYDTHFCLRIKHINTTPTGVRVYHNIDLLLYRYERGGKKKMLSQKLFNSPTAKRKIQMLGVYLDTSTP